MKQTKKVSDTSIRVLETLKFLSQNAASIQDIIRYFEKKDPNSRVYTNEVILKYINTLKVFGFKFKKEKDKYVMLNTPNQLGFDEKHLKTLLLIKNCSEFLPEKSVKIEMHKFLQDLEMRFNDESRLLAQNVVRTSTLNFGLNYNRFSEQINEYEKYCSDGQKVKITYKDRHEPAVSIIVEPSEIRYKSENVYLRIYNPMSAELKDIDFATILEVKQLPLKANPTNMLSSVTFRLKDRLAKGYRLHDGEKLLKIETEGSVVILNQLEDRTLLLKRLMRYGENCEIISPKSLRDEMYKMITATLSNYK